MSNNNPFIVIEGLDGSGKSTVTRQLAQALEYEAYATPALPFAGIREKIDQQADAQTRFLFYLASLSYASQNIKDLLLKTGVVCDRFLYSTLTYHYALDPALKALDVTGFNLLKPDIVFYLTASRKARELRREMRKQEYRALLELHEYNDEPFMKLVETEFLKMPDLLFIETDDKPPDKVVGEMLYHIERFADMAQDSARQRIVAPYGEGRLSSWNV